MVSDRLQRTKLAGRRCKRTGASDPSRRALDVRSIFALGPHGVRAAHHGALGLIFSEASVVRVWASTPSPTVLPWLAFAVVLMTSTVLWSSDSEHDVGQTVDDVLFVVFVTPVPRTWEADNPRLWLIQPIARRRTFFVQLCANRMFAVDASRLPRFLHRRSDHIAIDRDRGSHGRSTSRRTHGDASHRHTLPHWWPSCRSTTRA